MKKIAVFTIVVILLITSFCSCAKSANIKNEESAKGTNSASDTELEKDLFPIRTYASLEIPYPNNIQSDFDKEMISNPIDSKMKPQLDHIMSSGVREQQVFFDNYLKLWTTELEQSLSDLKSYLSEAELNQLNQSQQQWENAILYNDEFEKNCYFKS